MTDAPPTPPARPSSARWPWVVAAVAVAALAVGAWFAGEHIARGIVTSTIRTQLITQLSLPADHPIDIELPGPILPQLVIGSFAEVTISSDDVPVGDVTADVTVDAQDVPLRGGDWSSAHANVRLDEAQVRSILARVEGFPADSVTLDSPDVAADFELQLFALSVPVGVSFTPRADGGDIVLAPASLRVAGADVTAEALTERFGEFAAPVLREWDICIADRLPSALTLTAIEVDRDQVVADFDIDSAILRQGGDLPLGACP